MTMFDDVPDGYAWADPKELAVRPPFSDLFPAKKEIKKKIAQRMRERGFEIDKPIALWRQGNVVVDGHTRRECAIETETNVLVCFIDFADEDEALDFAIANQRDRRNLTEAELFALITAVDKRRKAGRPAKELMSPDINLGESRNRTAEVAGTSPTKVSKARSINDYAEETGDTEERDAILAEEMSINEANNRVQEKKQERKARESGGATRANQCVAWHEDYKARTGEYPSRDVVLREGGFPNGTVQKARERLGINRSTPRAEKPAPARSALPPPVTTKPKKGEEFDVYREWIKVKELIVQEYRRWPKEQAAQSQFCGGLTSLAMELSGMKK